MGSLISGPSTKVRTPKEGMMRGQIKKNVAGGSGGGVRGRWVKVRSSGRRAVPVRNDDDNWRSSEGNSR